MTSLPAKLKFPLSTTPVYFGQHEVTNQVFHLTPRAAAIVNIRPLLPGHVLVIPRRESPVYTSPSQTHSNGSGKGSFNSTFLSALPPADLNALLPSVVLIQRTLRRVYGAEGFNVAVQDGEAAGQSVGHVHVHVIPRRKGDMDHVPGGGDALYEEMDGTSFEQSSVPPKKKAESERKDRSVNEMEKEAELLAGEMQADREKYGDAME